MRFLGLCWGEREPRPAVSRDEFERVKAEHERKIRELDEALHAWRDHEPDERQQPHAH